jgi:hypothetical protein
MNPRERNMAILLGAFIVLGGGGFFLYQFLYLPWRQQEANLGRLEDEITAKKRELFALNKELPKLATWRLISLPPDPVQARDDYGQLLGHLMADVAGWSVRNYSPGQADVKPGPTMSPTSKQPLYTSMTFRADADASESQIVHFLEEFAKAPVMHKIKALSVERPAQKATGGGDQKGQDAPGGKGAGGKGGPGGFGGKGFGGKGGPGGFGGKGFGDMKGKGFGNPFAKGGRGGSGEQVKVHLEVEALIVNGPDKHWTGLTGFDGRLAVLDALTGLRGLWGGLGWTQAVPLGLPQVPWSVSPQGERPLQLLAKTERPRNYTEIARARLYLGAETPFGLPKGNDGDYSDVSKFVKLIRISGTTSAAGETREAELINLLQQPDPPWGPDKSRIRLRDVELGGYKKFIVWNDDDEAVLRGEVLRLTDREVYFTSDGRIYAMQVGDTLEDAMEEALSEREAKRLGLLSVQAGE